MSDELLAGFRAIVTGAKDVARVLNDRDQLQFPVPLTAGLLPVAEQIIGARLEVDFKIKVVAREWKGKTIQSCLYRYPNRAEIHYSKKHNLCWRRFAIAKELAHLLFDSTEQFMIEYQALAQQLITDTPFTGPHASKAMMSEMLGPAGAIELLLPWRLRQQLFEMRDAGKHDVEIAKFCRVPQQYINTLLRSGYGEVSNQTHQELKEFDSDWSV